MHPEVEPLLCECEHPMEHHVPDGDRLRCAVPACCCQDARADVAPTVERKAA